MPIYEYICRQCSEISEILVTGSRKPACPNCGSKKLEKQLSNFSTRFVSTSVSTPPCGSSACPTGGFGCAGAGGGCSFSSNP